MNRNINNPVLLFLMQTDNSEVRKKEAYKLSVVKLDLQ